MDLVSGLGLMPREPKAYLKLALKLLSKVLPPPEATNAETRNNGVLFCSPF